MMHVKDVVGPLEVGRYYQVDCVLIRGDDVLTDERLDRRLWFVPVLTPAHHEPPGPWHYHTDQRFMGKKLLKRFGAAILLLDQKEEVVTTRHGPASAKLHVKELTCVAKQPKFPVFSQVAIEETQGQKMKNFICPHRGAYLGNQEVVNGCVTCPMHHLKFRCDTGELVNKPEDPFPVWIDVFPGRRLRRKIFGNQHVPQVDQRRSRETEEVRGG